MTVDSEALAARFPAPPESVNLNPAILCGRGGRSNHNPTNSWYLQCLEIAAQDNPETKSEKRGFVSTVIQAMLRVLPGLQFVSKEDTVLAVTDSSVVDKVQHKLREFASKIKKAREADQARLDREAREAPYNVEAQELEPELGVQWNAVADEGYHMPVKNLTQSFDAASPPSMPAAKQLSVSPNFATVSSFQCGKNSAFGTWFEEMSDEKPQAEPRGLKGGAGEPPIDTAQPGKKTPEAFYQKAPETEPFAQSTALVHESKKQRAHSPILDIEDDIDDDINNVWDKLESLGPDRSKTSSPELLSLMFPDILNE